MKIRYQTFLGAILLAASLAAVAEPAKADRVGIYIGGGGYYHGYYPGYYYPGYYPGWGYPEYYVAPPPVVTYAPPPPVIVPPSIVADQTSPTYTDELGRTCRQFHAGGDYNGKACLQPDGSWRIVP